MTHHMGWVRCFLLLGVLGWAAPVQAQEWARRMFEVTQHDFGTVARGAKAEFRFKFKNLYRETVHVAAVRSSCGCTTPTVTKRTLKSLETSEIVARYNTRAFLGRRGATITVVFDQPFYAEVQLHVTGYIRSDIVVHPEVVNLGTVAQGQKAQGEVTIDYAGKPDWQIVDVKSPVPYLKARWQEIYRQGNRIKYRLQVTLEGEAPAGFWEVPLRVVVNDRRREFPVLVQAKVRASVVVSPSPLFVGVVKPGKQASKRLVVRGPKPFRILNIQCSDQCFQFQVDDKPKTLHLITVTFQGEEPGKYQGTIHIETDLGPGAVPDVPAYARVRP